MADRGLALAAAVRVIYWIHRRAPHVRTPASPASPPRLAVVYVAMINIAHAPDGRPALSEHQTNFARRQAQMHIVAFAGRDARA